MNWIRWLSKRNFFFWTGLSGLVVTAITHLIIYHYQGVHITARFNFYLVWVIFLIVGLFLKK